MRSSSSGVISAGLTAMLVLIDSRFNMIDRVNNYGTCYLMSDVIPHHSSFPPLSGRHVLILTWHFIPMLSTGGGMMEHQGFGEDK